MENHPQETQKRSEVEEVGGTLGIIIVVVLLVAGGIYFFVMQQQKLQTGQTPTTEQANS